MNPYQSHQDELKKSRLRRSSDFHEIFGYVFNAGPVQFSRNVCLLQTAFYHQAIEVKWAQEMFMVVEYQAEQENY